MVKIKESKTNHKNPGKIRTATTYNLGSHGLCSGPEASGVKESPRLTSPASDFRASACVPCRQVVRAK